MRRGKRFSVILAGTASFLLLAAACSGNDSGTTTGSAGGDTPLSGNIVVSGSSTVEPISSLVAELFRENNPVTINVDGPGTGDGFALFCNGETDISDASRPIEDTEAKTRIAEIIDLMLTDDRRSWQLQPDATWLRTEALLGRAGTMDTFETLKEDALNRSLVVAAPHRPGAGAGSLDPRA